MSKSNVKLNIDTFPLDSFRETLAKRLETFTKKAIVGVDIAPEQDRSVMCVLDGGLLGHDRIMEIIEEQRSTYCPTGILIHDSHAKAFDIKEGNKLLGNPVKLMRDFPIVKPRFDNFLKPIGVGRDLLKELTNYIDMKLGVK